MSVIKESFQKDIGIPVVSDFRLAIIDWRLVDMFEKKRGLCELDIKSNTETYDYTETES